MHTEVASDGVNWGRREYESDSDDESFYLSPKMKSFPSVRLVWLEREELL